ncbi:hypothetical protein [Porphyromonas gulae]|uniref:hypothetical protein n=1 Tax=Porphyromonas gulae TaxID=111105 RepID=UPI00052D8EA2|nr:hypothetical protein [Porphyromonas gulae]KGN92618.1 hypothetical protein HQ46_00015 [Porphyromonas gulae]
MDEILRSLYLRLDTNTSYLAKNAESQLLVKILYQNPNTTFKEIFESYQKIVKNTTEQRLQELVDDLLRRREISKQKHRYDISKSKRIKIEKAHIESRERFDRIVKNFEPYFSETKNIELWLTDVIICFFNAFSDDWMSDLCYNVSCIARRKDSILDVIRNRTLNNKSIDNKDKDSLANKFIELILRKEPDITEFLWEYGTSAFAAKLIKNSLSIDDLTIETFKGSCCILDTNILMHIGLEYSEYYNSFKVLEDVFSELGINAGILHITQQEYLSAVSYKKDQILKVVERYNTDVLRETDDQYLQTAIKRGCRTEEEFSSFFNELLKTPKSINGKIPISLLDDDKLLEDSILSAQKDEGKQHELNSIFKGITGHDKKEQALLHDVGLISGANYLRGAGKYFIISQEVSVNAYAKKKPSVNDLPIAIRIETLLNVLALNGGTHVISSDYKKLFADIIRENLQPSKDAFTVPDLSIMLDKNEQISKLPSEKIVDIAQSIHRKRLLGASDEEITMDMTRRIQGAKIEVVEDLSKAQQELSSERRDKEHYRIQASKGESALRKKIDTEVRAEYRKKSISFWIKKIVILLLTPALLIVILWLAGVKELLKELAIGLLIFVIGVFFSKNKKIYNERKRSKEENINKEVDRRLNELLKEEG